MNVLLIYPEMPQTFWSLKYYIDALGKKSAYPPLGLLTVSSLLPGNWQKKLVDLNLNSLRQDELDWADIVFISAMNVQEASVREIFSLCKAAGKKTVAGGPLFTFEHHRFPEADHFVLNEAELTLPSFLKDLSGNNPRRVYSSAQFTDMHKTPLPQFDLLRPGYLNGIIQYSRGCPYLCDFCDVPALYGRVPRVKKPEQIIEELEHYRKAGVTGEILFADDNLIGNKNIVKSELLPALIKWKKDTGAGINFSTQLTITVADDDELLNLMKEAGFHHFFVGIETNDEEALFASMKKQNLKRDISENIEKIQRKGFMLSAGFIVGFDSDTPEKIEQLGKFINKTNIASPIINMLKAPPGTKLFTKMKSEGRIREGMAYAESYSNIIPSMNENLLYNSYAKLLKTTYSSGSSLKRIKGFLRIHNPGNNSATSFSISRLKFRLKAVIYTLFKVGLISNVRFSFWKLQVWTLLHRPRLLHYSFSLGIMIHQLNKISEHIISEISDRYKDAKEGKDVINESEGINKKPRIMSLIRGLF